jgi:hypothetical protein
MVDESNVTSQIIAASTSRAAIREESYGNLQGSGPRPGMTCRKLKVSCILSGILRVLARNTRQKEGMDEKRV